MMKTKFRHLWSTVAGIGGTCTSNRRDLKEFIKSTGGDPMKNGRIHDVKSKHLGVGVYKVWLEPRRV